VRTLSDEPRQVALPHEPLIAIVDDDASIREALKGLMKSMGYAVEVFPSADDFLASPQLRATSCLIADVQMPVMTGVELYRSLKGAGHPIPTILITAYPDNNTRSRVLGDGVVCYLTKPFNETSLLCCVHSALGQGSHGTERATHGSAAKRVLRD
jgi:FixJ family two-component response regulator